MPTRETNETNRFHPVHPIWQPEDNIDAPGLKSLAQAVLETEARAVESLASRIDDNFVEACRILLACQGRIVVSGMGKSGHIAGKIEATLASTGSPAFFVHPGEASHGDLGMVQPDDVMIGISNSGNSPELVSLLPTIKRLGVPLIALTGKAASPIAQAATITLDIGVEREACPMGLAPTASTTATLAMGDALAIALLSARGFDEEDFALSHPGGSLGRKLLLRVSDIMVKRDSLPIVYPDTLIPEALSESSGKGLGFVMICDQHDHLQGIFTDGDLRRAIDQNVDLKSTAVSQVMTPAAQSIDQNELAATAVARMQKHRINALPVTRPDGKVEGAINMHLLLSAGVV